MRPAPLDPPARSILDKLSTTQEVGRFENTGRNVDSQIREPPPAATCFGVRAENATPALYWPGMPDADRHIDDDDLERYVLDQLSEGDAAPIDEHLVACQQCQDRLAQVNQRVQAMRASRRRLG